MTISVIIPTHNPDPIRLGHSLAGLRSQTLPRSEWELIIVDNASATPLPFTISSSPPSEVRIVQESNVGLSQARRAGIREARGELIVFVDDDNVLAPDYLETVVDSFRRLPTVGAVGGKSIPEFAGAPSEWTREFFPLLAVRDLGEREQISQKLGDVHSAPLLYPPFAPIGAGMGLRRTAAEIWLRQAQTSISDRRGNVLSSGGDNDIILTVLKSNWAVAYIPTLRLTHLIPASRLEQAYLERLNHGIQKSWMEVLSLHNANPWGQIPSWSLSFRRMKAWFSYRAWQSSAAHIRWRGACGHFEGRVARKP